MAVKGIPRKSVVRLFYNIGYGIQPAVGVSYDEAEVLYSKDGSLFELKVLTIPDWTELGDGYYTVHWSSADMDTVGEFAFRVSVPITGEGEYFGTFEITPAPYGIPYESPTCLVTGNLQDIGGDPSNTGGIVFRPRYVPGKAGSSLITAEIIRTAADSFGNFNVKLLRGSQVIVEIEQAGIKNMIIIPDAPTANLIDLLPLIPQSL
jgi:hypothetical protein